MKFNNQDKRVIANQLFEEKEYWSNKLSEEIEVVNFPYDYLNDNSEFQYSNVRTLIDGNCASNLLKISKNSDIKIYVLLTSALILLLEKYTSKTDIIVGTPIISSIEKDNILNRLLILRNQLDSNDTFKSFLIKVNKTIAESDKFKNYPYEVLADDFGFKDNNEVNELFNVFITYKNIHQLNSPTEVSPKLNFVFEKVDDAIELSLEYNPKFYHEKTVRRISDYYLRLLSITLDNIDIKISEIELLLNEERNYLINEFNNTETKLPHDRVTHELFEEQAKLFPEKIAIEINNSKISYEDLNKQSNSLARYLISKGAVKDDIIALILNHSVDLVVSILAVLKAGCTYLPVDPEIPPKRLEYIIKDSSAKLIITKKDIEINKEIKERCVYLDEEKIETSNTNLGIKCNYNDYAYIIYTSGTTGNPKGVLIEHKGLINYASWAAEKYIENGIGTFPLYTSVSFDLTITSIFVPLLSGNKIVIYPDERKELLLQKVLDENKVNIVKLTPSHLKLIQDKDYSKSNVYCFIVGGERLDAQVALDIFEKFNRNVKIYNEYGPTETVVGSMIYLFNPSDIKYNSVPIGKPINNTEIFILDKNKNLALPGAIGEIHISGDLSSRKYLNKEELTKERYIKNPYLENKMMYVTGDLAKLHIDGNIEFVGRKDMQVNLRGFRIELEEIERIIKGFTFHDAQKFEEVPENPNIENFCKKCLIPIDINGVTINEEGVCNFCVDFEKNKPYLENYFKDDLNIVRSIVKKAKKGGEYDCLLLFSGGKDSTYVLYRLVEMGFNVLTFTFDNGYISDSAFKNIKETTKNLNVKNITVSNKKINGVFLESLNSEHNVCHGCWNVLNTLGIAVAVENNINAIISGLSRGQIYEMRLESLYGTGIFNESEIESKLNIFRKTFHSSENKYSRIIDTNISEEVIDKISFIDYFKYDKISTEEIKKHLKEKGWIQPVDTGFCSSNCLINDVGIHVYKVMTDCHFYSAPLSWDVRLGVLNRDDGFKEIEYNYDISKIENILSEIEYFKPPIKDAIVILREDEKDDPYLCTYLIVNREIDIQKLKEYLLYSLPDYMIPNRYVILEEFKLTNNGKIDISSLPQPNFQEDQYIEPKTEIEKELVIIWSAILNIDIKLISVEGNFYRLGGHSIKAMELLSEINRKFDVNIELFELFLNPTIRSISKLLEEKNRSCETIKRVEKREYFPITPMQKGMYFIYNLYPESLIYNIPILVKVIGQVNRAAFENAFNILINKYDTLRTKFAIVNDIPVQIINDEVKFSLEYYKSDNNESKAIIQKFFRPFNLNEAPLIRSGIIEIGEKESVFMIDIHHIISDGISRNNLIADFIKILNGEKISGLKIQYKDYLMWQHNFNNSDSINKQENFWITKYKDNVPELNLPFDFPRQNITSDEGNFIKFKFDSELSQKIKDIAKNNEVTLHQLLFSLYGVLVSKICDQEDIVIGIEVSGRKYEMFDELIGMFINTLALRNSFKKEMTFVELLAEIKHDIIESYENQDYPFERLVSKLAIERKNGKNPLFDVFFSFGQAQTNTLPKINGLELSYLNQESRISKFDLSLNGFDNGSEILFTIEYKTELFNSGSIELFIEFFRSIAGEISENQNVILADINIHERANNNSDAYEEDVAFDL